MPTIDVHFERPIDNSRIVREADVRCRSEYMCLTLMGAMFVMGILFYAWQQYQWIQYGYLIEESHQQIEELVEVRSQLRVERATLANPQRIDSIARTELGMAGPSAGQLVSLEVGSVPQGPLKPADTLVARRDLR